ncbi:hypothetical protein AB0903_32370, partial [Streptomyces sp. NPDC048389]|uniref:hypothetical protein n=1 Tax=Streptomyces sp. NPDC048389 TaxID=3154622 RepID=UPI003454893C
PAAQEVDSLLKSNETHLPVLLSNLISGGQVTVARPARPPGGEAGPFRANQPHDRRPRRARFSRFA